MTGVHSFSSGGTVSWVGLLAIGITLLFTVSSLVPAAVAGVSSPRSSAGQSVVSAGLAPGAVGAPTNSAPPSFPSPIQHVVVVMDENKNYSTVLAGGPFEAYLAHRYATATNDYSLVHNSVQAYQVATSGLVNHVLPNNDRNIGDLADASGLSWATFQQSMPSLCDTVNNWPVGYDTQHNPFILYNDILGNPTRCDAHDLTFSSWTYDVSHNSLPNYSFIAFNTTNDDHNASLAMGDAWLQSWLSPLINDSAIFSNTAFLITYDENSAKSSPPVNNSTGGQIYMAIVSPYSLGLSSDVFYNTYSLLTTAEWLLGMPGGTLGNDNWTLHPPMKDLFSFTSTSYDVKFTETGLPSGTSWSVTLNGATQSSTSSTITFTEPNGKYDYTATEAGSASTSGSFLINGSKLTVTVAFYKATFKEKGLLSGTIWTVTVNGTPRTSKASATVSTIVFYLAKGTYSYTVNATGYTAKPSMGAVPVNGLKVWTTVKFT